MPPFRSKLLEHYKDFRILVDSVDLSGRFQTFKQISNIYKFQIHRGDLKSLIQWKLLSRLLIVGSLISAVLSAAVFFVEFRHLGRLVNDRASEIASTFNDQIRHKLDKPEMISSSGLQQDLKLLLIAGKFQQWMGQLVFAGIYDLNGNEICTETDSQNEAIETVRNLVQSSNHKLLASSDSNYEFTRIDGTPFIQLTFPLTNSMAQRAAVIEGVFVVSPRASDEVVNRIMNSIIGAIAIVVLTTLILYPVIMTLIRQLSTLTEDILQSNIETLRVIGSAIAKRDSDTDAHNFRVTIYSVSLAETISLKPKLIQFLIKGAFLHDVGKIGISDQILLKPGKLSEKEFEEMKRHVDHGLDIVQRSEWLRDATDVVGYHHEKYEGGGYPYGLSGSKIPVNARIFAIADVFDALISRRPYKEPISYDEAVEILLQGRGSHFDPYFLDHFLDIAKPLYNDFADCSAEILYSKMESIIKKYFAHKHS